MLLESKITRVIGIGKYAEKRARLALGAGKTGPGIIDGREVAIDTCWHPSPASPLANRNNGEDLKTDILSVLNQSRCYDESKSWLILLLFISASLAGCLENFSESSISW